MKWLALLLLLASGCVADAFTGSDAQPDRQDPTEAAGNEGGSGGDADADSLGDSGGKADAGGDAALVDSGNDACVTESGNTACGRAADAYCAKSVSCGYMQSVQACRSWLNVNLNSKFDCSNGNYNKTVCTAPTDKCIGDTSQVSCGTIQTKAPDQTTPSCATFFGQF